MQRLACLDSHLFCFLSSPSVIRLLGAGLVSVFVGSFGIMDFTVSPCHV